MKIGLVTISMERGGVETYLLSLGKRLCAAGHDVEIVTTVEPGPWAHRVQEEGLRARHLAKPRNVSSTRHVLRLGKALSEYDLVFLNHAPYAQRAIGLLPQRIVVVPVIHNDHPMMYGLVEHLAQGWNVAVAVGTRIFEVAKERLPDRPVVLIQNGIELPPASDLSQRAPWSKPFRLLYVGRLLHAQKGVLDLPKIVRACVDRGADVRLEIIGEGEDRDRLLSEIDREGLGNRIEMLGSQPPEQTQRAMLRSHFLLLPSKYEGLPIVLLESQAAGCVPVCSLLPGVTDQALPPHGFVVPGADPSGFADHVAALAQDSSLWEEASAAAIQNVRERFSAEQMAARYLELIDRCAAGEFRPSEPRRSLRWKSIFGRTP
ncbi:MAG TPA: glycosyltransferase family 4 protein [Fimbriimonadaceae bacterium]|nr:glycosyltransferase family 4 protein [Fimbriimonadaceae bacterium]